MKQHHPTSKQVREVARKLENVSCKYPKGELDMGEMRVYEKHHHQCGTVHCHGGWYAIAVIPIKDIINNNDIHYANGADRMAKDLGFSDMIALELWAYDNPEIWGNKLGHIMFSHNHAFTPNEKLSADNISDIIQHWREVADRLEVMELECTVEHEMKLKKQIA